MNALTLVGGSAVSITSAEIAELVGSRHSDVMRSILRLAEKGVIRKPPTAFSERINNLGFPVKDEHFIFAGDSGKRDSIVVVAQLSPAFTARLVDRWQELESKVRQPAFAIPQTLSEALRLAADQADMIEKQKTRIEADKPKVAFVDRYVAAATGSKCFREVCKVLEVKEPRFKAFLYSNGIVYTLNGSMTPYQQHIDAGRFEVKAGVSEINGHAFNQMRFTPKGIAWIAGELRKAEVVERMECDQLPSQVGAA